MKAILPLKQDSYYFKKLPKLAQVKALNQPGTEPDWSIVLDQKVARLARKWKLKTGQVLDGGTENLILEVSRENGELAILKIALPFSSIALESIALQTANGQSYARLYEVDYSKGALLLERLGKPLSSSLKNIDEHIHIICSTLKKAWVKPHTTLLLPTSVSVATYFKDFIQTKWTELDKPFSIQSLKLANEFAEARIDGFKPENCVLVHGDAHGFNTLAAGNGEYKFIDPDGLLADKGFDLICLMRDWSEPLLRGKTLDLLLKRHALLAQLTDADETSIWQWGYLGRLVIGLTLLELGNTTKGRQTLEVADRISHYNLFR